VRCDRVARPSLDSAERPFELVVRERLDLPAVGADEVVVMLTVRVQRLEARAAVADLDPLDIPLARELLERAVHARDPDAPATAPEPVEDLLRAEAAGLAAEELDDRPSSAAVPVPSRPERNESRLGPTRSRCVDHRSKRYRLVLAVDSENDSR